MGKANQHTKIWDYLLKHNEGITPMEAFNKLYITKLSTRIGEMIRMGYKIKKCMEMKISDDGTIVRYMRYWRGKDA